MMPSKLIVKKLINASCQEVYEAWSNPEMLKKWFFPNRGGWTAISANEFKVGGEYRHEMISELGASFIHTGKYVEIIPNKKIVFTWTSPAVKDTRVTVELKPIQGQTEITLTHDLLPTEEEYRQHQEGWHACLSNLMKFLSKQNYQCFVSYQSPIENVYKALTSEIGLQGWWTHDCTAGHVQVGTEITLRFGPTFTVMKVKELIPNKKVVWECVNHHFAHPNFKHLNEWVGTRLTFQLEENKKNTQLNFSQEGLTPALECFSICENKWNYYLKDSLKSYVETGHGGPF